MKNKKYLFVTGVIILLIFTILFYILANKEGLKDLTVEEKIEDFEYMYEILKDNYSHFYEIKKIYGYDWLSHKEEFEKEIRKTKDNMEFYHCMQRILITELHDDHTLILDPSYYNTYLDVMKVYEDAYEAFKPFEKMFKKAGKKYEGWYQLFLEEYPDIYINKNVDLASRNKPKDNIKAHVIEEGKIAYLKIQSFFIDYGNNEKGYEKEKNKITNFLNDIKDYPYLIIDITGNGGGSSKYWIESLVSPLSNKDMKDINYEAINIIRGGDYTMKYFEYHFPEIKQNSIEKLDFYNSIPKEVKDNFKYYIKTGMQEELEERNSIGFNGKIFLIVDENVYSAADEFARFCNQSNFATLAGTKTTGSGGNNTMFMILPNSGLMLRFEAEMLLNKDGTSQYETGTIPDIEIQKEEFGDYGIKAMKEIIDIIRSEEQNK
ncbi:S41 family peptidase [Tissierella sp. MSJ-40]|uniref:S41 family peptidase n=1 Tax=Tissierella simiarum TaxID=2841534 RepID=A0ABS6E886_9FIRM|nr:S41 family peptidase [Tissierella simiarum]MBU5438459.1 S41 family peptidase [Tissierella simiarum]